MTIFRFVGSKLFYQLLLCDENGQDSVTFDFGFFAIACGFSAANIKISL